MSFVFIGVGTTYPTNQQHQLRDSIALTKDSSHMFYIYVGNILISAFIASVYNVKYVILGGNTL